MRTLVDIPDEAVQELDQLRRQEGLSRAEVIRRAIYDYLKAHAVESTEAFGIFKGRDEPVDGLEYQERLRSEW